MADVIKAAIISHDIVSIGTILPTPVEAAFTQQALDEAYNKGFAEGVSQAHAQIKAQADTFNALLQNIPAAVENNRLNLSTEITDIVLLIIQRFFIHQHQNNDAMASQITQTLSHLNQKHNIELALHPHDITLLQQGKLNIDFKSYKNLRITPDETLRLGGCIIRSEHGVFDASIERQVDSLKQVLLKKKRNCSPTPSSRAQRGISMD